jgi:hypothetical protein
MILLTTTSDKIQLITGTAGSIDAYSTWVDNTTTAVTPGRTTLASITAAATTDIIAAPASSTQRAIKSYITAQIGGGLSQLNVNTLTAGVVYIANNSISTTSGGQLNITAKMNFLGGIDGAPVALGFFMQR